MAFDDRTCWLVRAGGRSRYASEFVSRSLVSFAWDWDGITDLSVAEDADVFLTLESNGHKKPADDLRDLRMFSARMVAGDVVVVPDAVVGDLLFGEIVGDYEYRELGGDHRHTRPMRWFGRLSVREAPQLLVAHTTKASQLIRRLPEQTHWLRLAGEVDDFLGRDVTDVPRVASRTSSVRRGGAPKASPSRVKAPSKPQPVLVPDKLCPSCGLLRNPSMFPDGDDYCRDCA